MDRIIIQRSGSTVTAIINGKYHSYCSESEESAIEMVKDALAIKEQGESSELKEFFSPGYRVANNEYISEDRRGNFYLGNTETKIPKLLVERVNGHITSGLPVEPLVNFWKLLLTNPNEDVREDLFSFADRFNFPITSHGYFIAYKSVAFVGERDKEYALDISNRYVTTVAQGSNPEDIAVLSYEHSREKSILYFKADEVSDEITFWCLARWHRIELAVLEEYIEKNLKHEFKGWSMNNPNYDHEDLLDFAQYYGYTLPTDEEKVALVEGHYKLTVLGDLKEVFLQVPAMFDIDQRVFTDWFTKRSDIRLGVPVSMEMDDCDTNRDHTCSSGLHVGAPGYVKSFHGGTKRYILACLVNPADVAAVPTDYSFEKMRTAQYYPYAVCELDNEGNLEELDTKFFEDDYIAYEQKDIELKIEALRKDISADTFSKSDKERMEEMKELLSQRLVDISR